MNFGGVGYNIARGIMEENKPVSFITVVGRDGNMFA